MSEPDELEDDDVVVVVVVSTGTARTTNGEKLKVVNVKVRASASYVAGKYSTVSPSAFTWAT